MRFDHAASTRSRSVVTWHGDDEENRRTDPRPPTQTLPTMIAGTRCISRNFQCGQFWRFYNEENCEAQSPAHFDTGAPRTFGWRRRKHWSIAGSAQFHRQRRKIGTVSPSASQERHGPVAGVFLEGRRGRCRRGGWRRQARGAVRWRSGARRAYRAVAWRGGRGGEVRRREPADAALPPSARYQRNAHTDRMSEKGHMRNTPLRVACTGA